LTADVVVVVVVVVVVICCPCRCRLCICFSCRSRRRRVRRYNVDKSAPCAASILSTLRRHTASSYHLPLQLNWISAHHQ